jgi:hypothetical protein
MAITKWNAWQSALQLKSPSEPRMSADTPLYSQNSEAEAGGSEYEASLSNIMRPCLKKQRAPHEGLKVPVHK